MILFGALAAIVALVGGTMAYVVREADAGYHAASTAATTREARGSRAARIAMPAPA